MALKPLRIVKNWLTGIRSQEANWDEIADKTVEFATRTNNHLKQLGLDIAGASYEYNDDGRATQSPDLNTRVTTLESVQFNTPAAIRNIGLDVSTTSKVKIFGSDGNNLSSTNIGYVTIPSTTTPGQLVTRSITANMEVTLTAAHWGLDTYGDITDFALWVLLLDDGTNAVLGVAAQPGRNSIDNADATATPGSVTSIEKVLTSSTISSELNCVAIARILANFDDTGNPGGENYWTIQTGLGDLEFGEHHVTTYNGGEIQF